MMTKHRPFFSFVGLLLTCAWVNAASVLTIEDVTVTEGTAVATVRVFASGGDNITSFSAPLLYAGDGGPLIGGSSSPNAGPFVGGSFSTADGLMSIQGGANYDSFVGETFNGGLLANPSFGNFNPGTAFVTLNGTELFRFSVDVSALTAGQSQTYTFDNGSIGAGAPVFDTFGGGQSIATFNVGTVSVVSAIPEPSSLFAMCFVSGVYLIRRRR